jgi:hypothetical protein
MPTFLIHGNPGAGKTLFMSYFAYKKYANKRAYKKEKLKIYSNYPLYGIPFYRIVTLSHLNMITNGLVLGDELWQDMDSRNSLKKSNTMANNILLRSRKRKLILLITAQNPSQLDKRMRDNVDFKCKPQLSPDCSLCRVPIGNEYGDYVDTERFVTGPIYKIYDTNFEVPRLIDDMTKKGKKANAKVLKRLGISLNNAEIIKELEILEKLKGKPPSIKTIKEMGGSPPEREFYPLRKL